MPWLCTNGELRFDSSVDANAYCNNIVHDGPFFQQGASLIVGSTDVKEIFTFDLNSEDLAVKFLEDMAYHKGLARLEYLLFAPLPF